jgi:predicted acylesterase/phospholipase RssA
MKEFRKNVAVAIDGGGIKGVIVCRALAMLEKELGKSVKDIFRLAVGTSTGSIISAGIGAGITASEMYNLYVEMGAKVFPRSWRTFFWPLSRYKYPKEPIEALLLEYFGGRKMSDYWTDDPPTDIVITTFDLVENRTRFIKPWKEAYGEMPVTLAIRASCTVPTFFPIPEGRYLDGGVGSYANPCYLAAYEARFCLDWDPAETTLISFGTGRDPHSFDTSHTPRMWSWEWLMPMFGAFLNSADDQQVHLVKTFFDQLDFRRFQVEMRAPIDMDDPSKIPQLAVYGDEMGRMLLNDQVDSAQKVIAQKAF